jgi:hypothetical protein
MMWIMRETGLWKIGSKEYQRTARPLLEWLQTPHVAEGREELIAYHYGVRAAQAAGEDAWADDGLLKMTMAPAPTEEEIMAARCLGPRMLACWAQQGAIETRREMTERDKPPIS